MEQARAIIYVLDALVRRGLKQREAFGMSPPTSRGEQMLAKKLQAIINEYTSFDRNDLTKLHQSPLIHSFAEGRFVALETSPYTAGCAAFLWCKWDLAGQPHCKFYYGLFRMASRQFVAGEKEQTETVPQFVGYRYESPSWQGPEHRFFHAQPNSNMSVDHDKKIQCAAPIPNDAPTFPLPVETPLELLLCLILSVLGTQSFDSLKADLENQDRANRNKTLTAAVAKVRGIVK